MRVMILGDSTMQGHQIPDGMHYPHLLEAAFRDLFGETYVLPLAVGGYGTVQQWLLFEEYYESFRPDVIIHHWCDNDPVNNDFDAEWYSFGNNNALRRPYLENGELVYRRPYPLRFGEWIDNLVIVKLANLLLTRWFSERASPEELARFIDRGYAVADQLLGQIAERADVPLVGLVEERETRAIALYRRHGYHVVTYSMPAEYRRLPWDNHPNSAGHRLMLERTLPVLTQLIQQRGGNN